MLTHVWKFFLAILFPGGLILLAAIGFFRPHGLPLWLQPPIAALPYIVLSFGLIFGWHFSSSRMILSMLVLTLADQTLKQVSTNNASPSPTDTFDTMVAITAFLVPLNLLAFSLLKEDAIWTFRGMMRVILVLAQPVLLLWLCLPDQQDIASAFTREYIPSWYTAWTLIPQPALFVFAIALILHFMRFAIQRDPLEGGAIWALIAIFVAYHTRRYGWQSSSFFAAAGLILFVTLLQSFHQRTYRDALTGLPGHLAYEEAVGQLGVKFSVAIIGIDQLTHYANTYGKPVSEQVLKLIAPHVHAACTKGKVFRTTGEGLTVLFPGKSAIETMATLDSVRKTIEAVTLYLRGEEYVWEAQRDTAKTGTRNRALPITLSIGVAERPSKDATLNVVIKSAYRALYEAKVAGGNVVKRGMESIPSARRPYAESGRVAASREIEM